MMYSHSNARSVYSSASHLLSPTSLSRDSSTHHGSISHSPSRSPSGSRSPSVSHSSRDHPPSGYGSGSGSGSSRKPPRSSRSSCRHPSSASRPSRLARRPATPFVPLRQQRSVSTTVGPSSPLYAPSSTAHVRQASLSHQPPGTPRRHRSSSQSGEWRQPELDYNLSATSGHVYSDWDRGVDHDIYSEIIMGVDMDKDGRVGCAYYVVIDEALHVEEDIALSGLEMVDTLLLRIQPTTVIVPNRAPGTLVELLERDAQRLDDDSSSPEKRGYILRRLVSAEFDYESGRDILANLDLEPRPPNPVEVLPVEDDPMNSFYSSNHGKLVRLAQDINLDSHLSIGCAGAVLGDIERRRVAEASYPDADDRGPFQVLSVKVNTPAHTMLVSADALVSLQIIQSEIHPNPQTQYPNSSESRAKESLSVYGLLQALTCTAQGKLRLRQMLCRPTTEVATIERRQGAIGVFLHPENQEVVSNIRKMLRKVKNTKSLLRYIRMGVDRVRGQLSIRTAEWRALLRFTMVSIQIREAIQSLQGYASVDILARILDHVDPPVFMSVGESILRTIDFKLSKENGRTEIRPRASETLDELRRSFSRICKMLPDVEDALRRELSPRAARRIQYCTLVPQLGFFIAVALDQEMGGGFCGGEGAADDDWHVGFVHEDLAYYKNSLMLDLDFNYGELPSQISDEEINLILNLSAEVLAKEDSIIGASELFGELDSLLALALAAEKYGWTAPQMTYSNIIEIVGGRHPLQELLVPSFIPNDCFIEGGNGSDEKEAESCVGEGDDMSENGNLHNETDIGKKEGSGEGEIMEEESMGFEDRNERPSMLILTGPNSSGKSIYMKQVAIIVYLAHIGSYVPATNATIGITDRILTRIATRETVVDDESAFLVDVKRAAFTINFATRRSLILADEFGKGTSTETGSALFTAYLAHFLDLAGERPKLLVGTHFHEIFENGILESREAVEFAHMDVRLNEEADEMEDEVTYLFKLLPGLGESSLASSCAAKSGVNIEIIERAEDFVLYQEANEDLQAICGGLTPEEQDNVVLARSRTRRFMGMVVPKPNAGVEELGFMRDALFDLEP